MTALQAPLVKYSTGSHDIGTAKDFPWEFPVPDTAFWNDLDWSTSTHFLREFTPSEIEAFNSQLSPSLSKSEKLSLLQRLLGEKLAREDAAASLRTLLETDLTAWQKLQLSLASIVRALGDIDEEERIVRAVIEQCSSGSEDVSMGLYQHLGSILERKGEYEEAVEMERRDLVGIDEKLGVDSPQAIGGRRCILKALWKAGKKEEAEAMTKEIWGCIEMLGKGKYAVYKEEEEKEMKEVMAGLEGWEGKV